MVRRQRINIERLYIADLPKEDKKQKEPFYKAIYQKGRKGKRRY